MKHIIFFVAILFSLTANAGVIRLSSAELLVNKDDIVDYQIFLEDFTNLAQLTFDLEFDPQVLTFSELVDSDYFIGFDEFDSDVAVFEGPTLGSISIVFSLLPDVNGAVDYFDGLLANLSFNAISDDVVSLFVTNIDALDEDGLDVEVSTKVSAPSTLALFALGLAFVRIRKSTPH